MPQKAGLEEVPVAKRSASISIIQKLVLLKLGKLLRFVPNSVLTGFINGIAFLIILGQLGDLTGYDTQGNNKVAETLDLFFNLNRVDLPSLAVGVATIVLILQLEKTRLKALGMVAAMLIASMLVPLFNWDSIHKGHSTGLVS